MARYFGEAPPADAAWAVFFLTGRRLKRLVPYAAIHDWTLADTHLPSWLLEESYSVVGDGAETAALVLDQLPAVENTSPLSLAQWVEARILTLRDMAADEQRRKVTEWWAPLDRLQRFVLLKMITGELRVGVSQTLVVRALSQAGGIPVATVAARLMGEWTPTAEWFGSVLSVESTDVDQSRPYPFFLASPLDEDPSALGDLANWILEWKWDGIRAQLVKRARRHPPVVARRGADHPSLPGDRRGRDPSARRNRSRRRGARVPRRTAAALLRAAAAHRPPETGRADGEGRPGRVHDLRHPGAGRRGHPCRSRCSDRRQRLTELLDSIGPSSGVLRLSPSVTAAQLGGPRATAPRIARPRRRRPDAQARVLALRGRQEARRLVEVEDRALHDRRGAHLRAAGQRQARQPAHRLHLRRLARRRARADREGLLRACRTRRSPRWIAGFGGIRVERFGPVRHVEPIHVFELGFEGIARSPRHRSGIAVRFPRMLRWRKDKRAEEADTLENVRRLLESVEGLSAK